MSIVSAAIRFLLLVVALVSGFTPSPLQSPPRLSLQHESASSSDITDTALSFPVLRRIAGIEWTGPCRYVGADLKHVKDLKLFGGIRYDVDVNTCTLSSFLTFPNGKTREVVMTGKAGDGDGPLRLDAEDGNGYIYMMLTELAPDTILINEVDRASGKIVMTASLSVVTGAGKELVELIQVSHEVGDNSAASNSIVEGHQVWRLKPNLNSAQNKDSEFDVRLGTTGR
jgi:hypothetical protein